MIARRRCASCSASPWPICCGCQQAQPAPSVLLQTADGPAAAAGAYRPTVPIRLERAVKILPVGAISFTIRVPFAVGRIEDLVDYHDLRFSNGVLQDEVRQLADEIRRELRPFLVRPVSQLSQEEAYTVFCIESPLTTALKARPSARRHG